MCHDATGVSRLAENASGDCACRTVSTKLDLPPPNMMEGGVGAGAVQWMRSRWRVESDGEMALVHGLTVGGLIAKTDKTSDKTSGAKPTRAWHREESKDGLNKLIGGELDTHWHAPASLVLGVTEGHRLPVGVCASGSSV